MTDLGPTPRRRWHLSIDGPDVIATVGVVLVLAGAAAIHWALAVMVAGGGLCALAWRLSGTPGP